MITEESLNDEINAISKKILLLAQENELARLLMTVPGIAYSKRNWRYQQRE